MSVQRIVIDNFLGGLSPSRYIGNVQAGESDPTNSDRSSAGWDVFNTVEEAGLLRRGFGEGAVTNVSLIQGKLHWMKTYNRVLGSFIYAIGQDDNLVQNRLYRVELDTDTVTNSTIFPHQLPTSSPLGTGLGMEYYDGFLYYSSGRYLGRYDMSLTFDNSFYNFLGTRAIGTSIEHPMIQGNGKLFIGNSNFSLNTASIATFDGASVIPNALDLGKTEQFIRAIEFNKDFLYIATTNNTEDNSRIGDSFLYIWDTVSTSWQEQYKFPEEDLRAIRAFNGRIYTFGNRGAYLFSGNEFQPIISLSGGPSPGGTSIHPAGFISWHDGAGQIYSCGTMNPRIPSIPFKPYFNPDAAYSGAIQWTSRTKLWATTPTDTPKLRVYSGSTTYETASWKTPMINFGIKARLSRIYLYFLSWPSGCTVDVKWASGDGSSMTTLGTINTTGATSVKFSADGLVDDSWQIILTHTGGTSPKFRKMVIEWEPELE